MMTRKLKLYLSTLYLLFGSLLYISYIETDFSNQSVDISGIILFVFLAILTESLMVKFNHLAVSSGFAITLASLLRFDTFFTMIIICFGFAFRIVKNNNNKYTHILNTPIYKTLFNMSNMAISIYISSTIANFILVYIPNTYYTLARISIFVLLFLIVNNTIVSLLLTFLGQGKTFTIFKYNFKFGILNIVAMAPFGFVLFYLYDSFEIPGILILMIPILLSRYTFSLYIEVRSKYIETVEALMHAVEARDKYTEGHSRRVADIATIIAKELKFSESKIEQLKIAALLHDVGKIGIDDSILNKPGKLTSEEFDIIKQHPIIGYDILKNIKDLDNINMIVKHHHERYDGKGYPSGTKGDELPMDIYIIQLADSIDAMDTNRPYRKALTEEMIVNELINYRGTQFHPIAVDAYIRAVRHNN